MQIMFFFCTFFQNHEKQLVPDRVLPRLNILLFPYSKSSILTMLWDQTQKLPKDTFKQVESMYMEQGFPMDVRLHLAAFVESKFLTNSEVDESTAVNVASELLSQLDKKIGATPNDPDKYLMKNKLQELSDSLKVSILRLTYLVGQKI